MSGSATIRCTILSLGSINKMSPTNLGVPYKSGCPLQIWMLNWAIGNTFPIWSFSDVVSLFRTGYVNQRCCPEFAGIMLHKNVPDVTSKCYTCHANVFQNSCRYIRPITWKVTWMGVPFQIHLAWNNLAYTIFCLRSLCCRNWLADSVTDLPDYFIV